MKERPILFSGPMVSAILEGRKTQTRRVLKVQPPVKNNRVVPLYQVEPEPKVTEVSFHEILNNDIPHCSSFFKCKSPYGKIGDRLWVRETFRLFDSDECPHSDFPCGCPSWGTPIYRATHDCLDGEKWTPSIHMPRSASRILLEITNVRVERLNDISKEDAIAEGVEKYHNSDFYVRYGFENDWCANAFASFAYLWESVYGKESWTANPWVWVVEFKVIQGGAA